MIYLIRCGRYTKIGTTVNIERRLGMLQTGNPKRLIILAIGHGGEKEERFLHLRFHRLRVQGEWFRLSWWHVGWICQRINARAHTSYARRCKAVYRLIFWLNPF